MLLTVLNVSYSKVIITPPLRFEIFFQECLHQMLLCADDFFQSQHSFSSFVFLALKKEDQKQEDKHRMLHYSIQSRIAFKLTSDTMEKSNADGIMVV
jgi:hypothetical protein